jgi:hypothetical protein
MSYDNAGTRATLFLPDAFLRQNRIGVGAREAAAEKIQYRKLGFLDGRLGQIVEFYVRQMIG